MVRRGGAPFCVPPLIPHSGAPAFDGAPPGVPSFTAHAIGIFYGCDRSFYGRVQVFFICDCIFYSRDCIFSIRDHDFYGRDGFFYSRE